MKKYLPFLFLTFILLIPNVKASTYTYDIMEQDFINLNSLNSSGCFSTTVYAYNDFETFIKDSNNKIIFDNLYNYVKSEYVSKYQEQYPFYRIYVYLTSSSNKKFELYSVYVGLQYSNKDFTSSNRYFLNGALYFNGEYKYDYSGYTSCDSKNPSYFSYSLDEKGYFPLNLFETNFKFIINSSNDTYIYNLYDKSANLKATYTNGDKYPVYMQTTYEDYSPFDDYTTINLNDYAYVVLSLKDYSAKEKFKTTMSVKGQLCLSAGYNFGVSNKTTGVTDSCSAVYDDFTDLDVYVLESDLENHAVYYLTGYDKDIDNIVKVDTSLFDIHYISEEDKNNPVITINGKDYNIIPYDEMESNATQNTDAGIISGSSCKVGDLNCQATTPHNSTGTFEDIVKNIGTTLSGIWDSFVYFMNFVTKMFNTLPAEFRAISITTFSVGCVLGIIKIIKS